MAQRTSRGYVTAPECETCGRERSCDECGNTEHLSEFVNADLCADCARAARIAALAARVDAKLSPPAPVLPRLSRTTLRPHGVTA
jgi:hypothetical protein